MIELADLMGPASAAISILVILTCVAVVLFLGNSMYEDHVQEKRARELDRLRSDTGRRQKVAASQVPAQTMAVHEPD